MHDGDPFHRNIGIRERLLTGKNIAPVRWSGVLQHMSDSLTQSVNVLTGIKRRGSGLVTN